MDILYFLGQSLFYDGLILSSVSWVVKQKIPLSRYALALFGNLVISFTLFLTFPIALLLVPIVTVKLAFAPQNLKTFGIRLAHFYVLSACLSGVLHILRYFVNLEQFGLIPFLVIGGLLAVGISIGFMLKTKFLKRAYTLSEFEHQVTLYYGDVRTKGIGLVDTGNSLNDHRTGLPVMIVPIEKAPGIIDLIEKGNIKTWELGFSVVGEDESKMLAFKPTLLLIDDEIVKDVIVGLCQTSFTAYDFLLQPEITIR